MKLGRTLTALLLAGNLFLWCKTTEKKQNNPYTFFKDKKLFENYEKVTPTERRGSVQGEGYYLFKTYDTNNDGIPDVETAYGIRNINEKEVIQKNPCFYGFNLNQNEVISVSEVWMDEKGDGWNGNERNYAEYLISEVDKMMKKRQNILERLKKHFKSI